MTDNDNSMKQPLNLSGQFLIAMPGMHDPNFAGTVVYLCEHSDQGAMGLIINRETEITLENLFQRVNLKLEIMLPHEAKVLDGGPVATERGFVLHSTDKLWASSLEVNDFVAMTTSRDILEAIAKGEAPKHWLITLGYSGWGEGQLENELAANAWLSMPADRGILFDEPLESRFKAAFMSLGIDPALMSSQAGHA